MEQRDPEFWLHTAMHAINQLKEAVDCATMSEAWTIRQGIRDVESAILRRAWEEEGYDAE